jgi:hypothetical protein
MYREKKLTSDDNHGTVMQQHRGGIHKSLSEKDFALFFFTVADFFSSTYQKRFLKNPKLHMIFKKSKKIV